MLIDCSIYLGACPLFLNKCNGILGVLFFLFNTIKRKYVVKELEK
jgi:hypothetical protein